MSMGHTKCATKNNEQLFLNTSLIVVMFYQWKLTQTAGYSVENLFHLGSPCSSFLTADNAVLGSC